MASSAEYLEFILDLLRDVPSVTHRKMIRNSRPYFLPHGSGISTGQTAPMAPQGSFADDVGSQVTAFEPHASRFWLRAAASACGMGVALAGIPGRGPQRSAVARKAGSRWPPGASQCH